MTKVSQFVTLLVYGYIIQGHSYGYFSLQRWWLDKSDQKPALSNLGRQGFMQPLFGYRLTVPKTQSSNWVLISIFLKKISQKKCEHFIMPLIFQQGHLKQRRSFNFPGDLP